MAHKAISSLMFKLGNPKLEREMSKSNPQDDLPGITYIVEKKGIKGWLLVLCLSLIIFNLLGFIFVAPSVFLLKQNIIMFGFAINALFGVFIGLFFWSKNSSAITLAKVYFVAEPYITFVLWHFQTLQDPSSSGQMTTSIIHSVLTSIVWFSYLTFSKRVRNTYDITPNRKNLFLAFFMGALLGPIGTIYINVRIFFMSLLSSIAVSTIVTLIAHFNSIELPHQIMTWVWPVFFSIANLILANSWNEANLGDASKKDIWEVASVIGITLGTWEFYIFGVAASIYGGITLFIQHHVLRGIIVLLLTSSIMTIPANVIMTIISLIVGFFTQLGDSKTNSKNGGTET